MRKFFGILIKILPLLTLYKGITSGGARLGPFADTIKVALTQYEVSHITKATFDEYARSGKIIEAQDFTQFIQDNFHSQYSVLAREIAGDKNHDHAKDIWGNHYQLQVNQNIGEARVASAGPDGVILTKDDVSMDFPIEHSNRKPAAIPKKKIIQEVADTPAVESPEMESEFDEEGFDRYGFNSDGYDRDGYDQNGYHRSEKETQYAEVGP